MFSQQYTIIIYSKIRSNFKIKEFEDNLLNRSLSTSINYNLRDKNKKLNNCKRAVRLHKSVEERKESFKSYGDSWNFTKSSTNWLSLDR